MFVWSGTTAGGGDCVKPGVARGVWVEETVVGIFVGTVAVIVVGTVSPAGGVITGGCAQIALGVSSVTLGQFVHWKH